ncbi:hypothetical protein [Streptomyces bobili]
MPTSDWIRQLLPFSRGWAAFTACRETAAPGLEHALGDDPEDRTLCGIRSDRVTVYRHHFRPGAAYACRPCARRARAGRPAPGGLTSGRVPFP